jgi:glutaredoxin
MLKKYQSLILIILLVVVVWFVLTSRGNSNPIDLGTAPILFYSTTCPHCKNVEEYLTKNKVRAKIKIEELDVASASNVSKYQQAAEICQASPSQSGSVPFLYADKKCYFGDVDVINYFKQSLR